MVIDRSPLNLLRQVLAEIRLGLVDGGGVDLFRQSLRPAHATRCLPTMPASSSAQRASASAFAVSICDRR